MTTKKKAKQLLEKMNNAPISESEWDNCSEYARNDLKRKAIIVCDEILSLALSNDSASISTYKFYLDVKIELKIL